MRKTFAVLITAWVLAGCQSAPTEPASPETPSASPTGTPEPSAAPQDSRDLTIGFGTLGPVRIGMSKDEALATGVLKAGNPAPVEGCPEPPLLWKPQFEGVDVRTDDNETVVSLGISRQGPKTAEGIEIGSTLADIKAAYGDDLTGPSEAGYVQSGAFVTDGSAYIGFLFNEAPDKVTDASKTHFIETTKGKPDLMRDGC